MPQHWRGGIPLGREGARHEHCPDALARAQRPSPLRCRPLPPPHSWWKLLTEYAKLQKYPHGPKYTGRKYLTYWKTIDEYLAVDAKKVDRGFWMKRCVEGAARASAWVGCWECGAPGVPRPGCGSAAQSNWATTNACPEFLHG
jgi:hypothetical protein